MSALLYVPKNATPATPAPGILAVHGYINSRETQDGFAIEFARRGYVVLSLDQTGHGYSQGPAFSNGFGGPDGLKYLRSLPMVDVRQIGLEGHSMGGWAVLAAAAAMPNDYASMVLEGSSTGAPFAQEGSPNWPRNAAVVFSRYDEFAKVMWGVDRAADAPGSGKLQALFGTADAARDGAGERALFVAEQLAFDKIAGDRGGVDRNERPGAAIAELVDRLGHKLLARAGFAEDQHGQIVAQHARDHAVDRLHRRAAANQRQAGGDILGHVFGARSLARANRLAHGAHQFIEVKGLDNIIVCASFQTSDAVIQFPLGGEHENRNAAGAGISTKFLVNGEPILARQHEVQHDHIRAFILGRPHRLNPIFRRRHRQALPLEIEFDQLQDVRLVINNQYSMHVF